jgi:putative membrane protein
VLFPHDLFTWFLETFPAFIGLTVLAFTYQKFPLTPLAYILIAIHCVILFVGGHYTYAEVPLFNWLRDSFHLGRNHYDRLGHFWQGFGPAIVAREVIIRTSPLKKGKWLFFLVMCFCLSLSAAYELLEWRVAAATGSAADAFLGTQGDPWDTQEDMAAAWVGSLTSLYFLASIHDRQLKSLENISGHKPKIS